MKAADVKRLKLLKKAGSVLEVELETLVDVSERRMLHKLFDIRDNPTQVLHAFLEEHQRTCSRRLSVPSVQD